MPARHFMIEFLQKVLFYFALLQVWCGYVGGIGRAQLLLALSKKLLPAVGLVGLPSFFAVLPKRREIQNEKLRATRDLLMKLTSTTFLSPLNESNYSHPNPFILQKPYWTTTMKLCGMQYCLYMEPYVSQFIFFSFEIGF